MFRLICLFIIVCNVLSEEQSNNLIVTLEDGIVSGEKYWNGDFYEFYGIPYATVPTGRDRFKAPLPATKWKGVLTAKQSIECPQTYYTGEDADEIFLSGEEDCLVMNLLVPQIASKDNLVPVVVYIHSGAFAVGYGNMAKYHYLARHDIIVASFNFRLGAVGFACLGTEEIPGNAGMKDAVAALRWINRNIKKFGGDPNKVTLAGFSVGAAMAELLALSKTTDGLIDKLILESGSALAPYAINRDPISTAFNIAKSIGYNETSDDLKDLADFYINAKSGALAAKSLNFFLKNSTFGFAPCIENKIENVEPFLTESPLHILSKSDYKKLSVLTGFANMEGISRSLRFDDWSKEMNEDFSKFLPADLKFENKEVVDKVIKAIQINYFNGEKVGLDTLQEYIDYFSDSMFKYSILKSANIHAQNTKRPVYLYEFSYVGTLNMKHNYMDKIKGASHRDQSSYILDFFASTLDFNDLDMRDRMTSMWADFVKYEDPTRYESPVVDYKWLPYAEEDQNYLAINVKTEMRKGILGPGFQFWKNIYDKYYWNPTAPKIAPQSVKPSTPNKTVKNKPTPKIK